MRPRNVARQPPPARERAASQIGGWQEGGDAPTLCECTCTPSKKLLLVESTKLLTTVKPDTTYKIETCAALAFVRAGVKPEPSL